MTMTQIIQLYAPFVGLMALSFWMGVLSNRVKNAEDKLRDLQADHDAGGADHDLLIELKTMMGAMGERMESFDRALQTANRQLATWMTGKGGGKVIELGGDHG